MPIANTILALTVIMLSVKAENIPAKVQIAAEPSQDTIRYIRGIVKDSTDKLPLPGVTLVIKGQQTGTVAGLEGVFILEIPASYKGHNIMLESRSVGFINKSISVNLVGDTTFLKEDIFLQHQALSNKFIYQQDPGDTLLPVYIHPWLRLERHKNAVFRKRIAKRERIEI